MTTKQHATALLALATLAGCRSDGATGDGGWGETPSVVAQLPDRDATGVALNASASATFNVPMDPATLTETSFTLTDEDGLAIAGTVIYADRTAEFWPGAHLEGDRSFTATVTTEAESAAEIPLDEDYSWTFTTGTATEPGLPVRLGAAEGFVVLAKSGISTVPMSALTGDIGVSPAAATYLTGFSLTADPSNVFSTSPQVTGRVFAADYAVPTPADMTTAIGDMELAFVDAAGRAPDVTELGAGNIGGMTLAPGVYAWGTGLLIPADVTLDGSGTDVWIFQIAQDLTISSGTRVVLTGGARPANVFWQVSGLVDLGTTAHCEGVVLTRTSVTLRTGASLHGRVLAQTAVALDESTVVEPTP